MGTRGVKFLLSNSDFRQGSSLKQERERKREERGKGKGGRKGGKEGRKRGKEKRICWHRAYERSSSCILSLYILLCDLDKSLRTVLLAFSYSHRTGMMALPF